MDSFLYILRSIIALIAVIWLANIVLRHLNKLSGSRRKTIQVIEQLSVGKSSSLAVVKIVDDYYLMSFSENQSEILQRFSKEEAAEIEERLAGEKNAEPLNRLEKIDLREMIEKFAQRKQE